MLYYNSDYTHFLTLEVLPLGVPLMYEENGGKKLGGENLCQ